MNDEQIDDLKQFIEAKVSQSESRMTSEIKQLRDEVLSGFTGVGEAIEGINDRLDKKDKEFDRRLTNLEDQIQAV